MIYLGYALLALLSLVSLVCFIRSYRNIRDGKISRRLIDIGIAAITLFGAGVVLAFTSVTTMALLDGSFALKLGLAGVGALGLVLLIIGKPADGAQDRQAGEQGGATRRCRNLRPSAVVGVCRSCGGG